MHGVLNYGWFNHPFPIVLGRVCGRTVGEGCDGIPWIQNGYGVFGLVSKEKTRVISLPSFPKTLCFTKHQV